MKKFSKTLIIAILLGSFFLPFLTPVVATPADGEIRRFRIGLTGTPAVDWDIAISSRYGTVDLWYWTATCEFLYATNGAYDRGFSEGVPKQDTYLPALATSWEFEMWPEEMNSQGFINKGGAANVTFRLREGVTFHDGSAWNATVAKWNIDRIWIITGNLTGRGDLRNKDTYWYPVSNYANYYTESWNLSSILDTYYGFGVYDGYYNPRPSDGGAGVDGIWFTSDDDFVAHTPYNLYPIVKRVVITDDLASGGEIRIEFNDWNMYGMTSVGLIRYISMETYADFWDRGIYGFDNADPLYPDHMIGTGSYMYVEHDEAAEPGGGSLQKNPNYWNGTALEDAGWYDADFIDIITWPAGTLGIESRNTALMTNAIDYALDNFFTPVDYDDVMSNDRIRYMEAKPSDYITAITLNCIDDTWWPWPGIINWSTYYLTAYPSGNTPAGVPRALRKAMSYAFDYDKYINVGLNGRAVRASALGVTNIYYDDTVPIAYHNLTIARETLLNDPVFGPICAAQGLTASSTDSDWQDVANGVGGAIPIWSLEFYWDDNFETLKNVFQTSLEDIGITLADETGATGYKLSTTIWTECQTYWLTGFPVFSADAWPLDWNIPEIISEGWIDAYYADPDDGRWRPPNYDFNGSIFWPDYNLAFTYATETDQWVHEMYLTNDTARGGVMNKIANWSQNYQYPWIFVSQSKEGFVIWKDWEMSAYWGATSYTHLRYTGFPSQPPIPGFSIGITIIVSAVSVVSVVYVIMRKKKIH